MALSLVILGFIAAFIILYRGFKWWCATVSEEEWRDRMEW
jgi:hypothetical protein